jgi:hypothetical protein
LISGVYGNGSFLYQADLGVILGSELELRAIVEAQRQSYLDELIRVVPHSSKAMRKVEYLKRDRARDLLLSYRTVQNGIELLIEGTGLEVVVGPDCEESELNLSFRDLDRYKSLQFALQQINARAVVTENSIRIEPLPRMVKE